MPGTIIPPPPPDGMANVHKAENILQVGVVRVPATITDSDSPGRVIAVTVDDFNRILKHAYSMGWNAHIEWEDFLQKAANRPMGERGVDKTPAL